MRALELVWVRIETKLNYLVERAAPLFDLIVLIG
jgi:hypothetical protein